MGEPFGYVSEEELAAEIDRRRADIERTERRIADLSALELQLRTAFHEAQEEAKKRQQTVVQRTRLFYRLSKSGGSLRYLLGSTSATQFLKRLALLRHLLKSSLESQRQSNLRYTKISTQLSEVTDEKENSRKILSELHGVLAELQGAQARREEETLRR